MNHRDKLLKRLNNDTFLKSVIDKSVRKDSILNILECVDKRVFNKIPQSDMAEYCKVSVETIKRFENLKCDSLSLYLCYITYLKPLLNRKKKKTPSWVHTK